jgi:hypothetical protein
MIVIYSNHSSSTFRTSDVIVLAEHMNYRLLFSLENGPFLDLNFLNTYSRFFISSELVIN